MIWREIGIVWKQCERLMKVTRMGSRMNGDRRIRRFFDVLGGWIEKRISSEKIEQASEFLSTLGNSLLMLLLHR